MRDKMPLRVLKLKVEIGRPRVFHFCGEILDEEPDPSMLQKLEGEQEDAEMA
jgi:hypothetical protein